MSQTFDEETKRKLLKEKNEYNLMSALLLLFTNWFMAFVLALMLVLVFLCYPHYGMTSVFVGIAAAFVFTILWTWFVERAALHFGHLEPKVVPLLDGYFWFHERMWKLTGLWLIAPAFSGTPFKNIFSRMEGIRMGKRVFDDGCYFDEYSLIEIGDYSNLNSLVVIQPHSLEEGVFKSGRVKLGKGCTLGVYSNLHYDITMGDYVVLEANAFLMKGEILDSDTTWRGNPARSVGGRAAAPRAAEAAAAE